MRTAGHLSLRSQREVTLLFLVISSTTYGFLLSHSSVNFPIDSKDWHKHYWLLLRRQCNSVWCNDGTPRQNRQKDVHCRLLSWPPLQTWGSSKATSLACDFAFWFRNYRSEVCLFVCLSVCLSRVHYAQMAEDIDTI